MDSVCLSYESSKEMSDVSKVIDRFESMIGISTSDPLSNHRRENILTTSSRRGTEFPNHPDYDAFWKRQGFAPWLNKVTVPMLNVAGWWDQEDFYGPIKIYEASRETRRREPEFPGLSGRGITEAGREVRDGSSARSTSAVLRRSTTGKTS